MAAARLERTVKAVEASRDDESAWDFENPRRVSRGAEPSAVLSVRVPLSRLEAIRDIAAREKRSISELLQAAVDAYLSSARPTFDAAGVRKIAIAGDIALAGTQSASFGDATKVSHSGAALTGSETTLLGTREFTETT